MTAEFNADETRDKATRGMRLMLTELRRVEEMATAVARQTGDPKDRAFAERAEQLAREADEAMDAMLAAEDDDDGRD